ncbi:hypothetical protein PS662_04329 [Pseudomonas fluorescens]|uniref:Uncharacterized protein n=1 Tax=Pseudomonas fluorescens TaxID=294 RepID=A0A5E6VWA8_PSEFL|nr:hypothetical protein [Pseudomonas fluorescens]VVN20294.1 hypothetical protein PS662_04329 [Pseudomonas fluorescens]
MLDANIHHSLNTLTASQTAKLLVMHHGIDAFGYKYDSVGDAPNGLVTLEDLASMSGEDLDQLYDESSHDDAVNEVRYSAVAAPGVPSWCHYSWERNYDVDVKAFILPDGRALAFCEMSGGGKHGEPDAYPWVEEAKFIKVSGVEERVIKTYKFEDIPEASEVTP